MSVDKLDNVMKIKIKVLSDIPGYTAGQMLSIDVDMDGIPCSRFWRRRFSDAKTDNCVDLYEPPKESIKKSKQSKSKKPK